MDTFRTTIDRLRILPMAVMLALAVLVIVTGQPPLAHGQMAPLGQSLAAAGPATTPSEPIFWKQNLFLIPYQWSSAADPGGARAVWLFVSKDGGATWQKISEAKPQVRAFTYRAEQDGQYWFAIRTIDHAGRAWPAGPYQPELRVIVDTTKPRVDELKGITHNDGTLEIHWRALDNNLDAGSWKIEVQTDASAEWQPVPLPPGDVGAAGTSTGHTTWSPAAGIRATALRAMVYDRAGNFAVCGAEVRRAPVRSEDAGDGPTVISGRGELPLAGAGGWISGSAEASLGDDGSSEMPPQPWPADSVERAPFRLFGGPADSVPDTGTTYGRPPGVGGPLVVSTGDAASDSSPHQLPLEEGRGEDDSQLAVRHPDSLPREEGSLPTRPKTAPLEPFREASLSRLPSVGDLAERGEAASAASLPPGWPLSPGDDPKLVCSRTFAMEYALEEVGRWGVSTVELWGTRDGGQTWRRYATDDDNRSPVQVTVDGEGVYGFRIVVQSAAGAATFPPQSGDRPELWVAVDLQRPTVELTAIEPGSGNQVDYLILRWRAEDDNLEPRPISLFYSTRPAGPWSAVATNLENSGEYAWRLERQVPARFYLRLEARDTAGNLAAYQTAEPVLLERPQPTGRLQGIRPINSAARPLTPAR
jgi:hypothetical protein